MRNISQNRNESTRPSNGSYLTKRRTRKTQQRPRQHRPQTNERPLRPSPPPPQHTITDRRPYTYAQATRIDNHRNKDQNETRSRRQPLLPLPFPSLPTFAKAHTRSNAGNIKQSVLYVKDKFSISNEAFHELSTLSDLPSSYCIKTLTRELNSQFEILRAPNGMQQSLRNRVLVCLTRLIANSKEDEIPNTIRIKLTGDGTLIARGLNVVNIAFTVLEDGQKASSVMEITVLQS